MSGAGLLLALLCTLSAACRPSGSELRGPGAEEVGVSGQIDADSLLLLHFLDVGQGDAVLIQSPSGQNVLYDGGEQDAELVARLRRLGVTELDLVIASHNHADHIGGLPEVIREFRPRFVLENGIPHTTRIYERFLLAIEDAGSQLLAPDRRTIRLGDAEIEILPPPGRRNRGQNDNSVGVVVRYGEFRATLLGDAEHEQFDWWLTHHGDLFSPVQVHKASHHGSSNGDSERAIRALRPEVVVIGVGAENTYGHPHPAALVLYRSVDATVYRADRHGSVRVEADPSGEYRVRTERGQSVAADECVDVNRADTSELARLIHIDAERAEQIVTLRRQTPFRSVEDLTRVRRLGAARVAEIHAEGLACVR